MTLHITVDVENFPRDGFQLMEDATNACLRLEGVERAEIDVIVLSDEAMHEINRDTRGVDRTTDVLSFPTVSYPHGTAKDNPALVRREFNPATGRYTLGDILISIERARDQAREYGHSLNRELGYLTAHATLHLLGYDHEQPEDKWVMRMMEERAMEEVGLVRNSECGIRSYGRSSLALRESEGSI